MQVRFVGSGDAFGSGGRFQTCIALGPGPDRPLDTLLDCGATTLTAMRAQHLDPQHVTAVVVTHLHGDHFGGLPFLILDGQFRRRRHDLTVLGPPGTARRLDDTMEALFPGSSTVARRFAVRVHEHVDRRAASINGLRVTPVEVRHAAGAPAYGVRVADRHGVVVAYSGDTEWTDALVELSDQADLFIAEGYSPGPVRWHLDLASLAEHRHRLGCRRLLLTHLSPAALEDDLEAWDVAHDGLTVNLP